MATTATASFCLILAPVPGFALPQGGQVVEGSAQINQTSDTRLDVIQSTDKAIIDWRSFSIGANEHTAFQQPSAQSLTLNRVTGSEASMIFGRLTANGQIMLVNGNGILFGAGSQVDVAGLVATTVDISNKNFMAGNYVFDGPGNPEAAVVNEGDITVADEGLAAFVAPGVANNGIIRAHMGQVALASGNKFTLDFYGDRKIQLAVDGKVVGKAVTADGRTLDSLVENTGTISADGGKVFLTANAVKGVVDNVINMEGVVQAQTAEMKGGEIVLSGGDAGTVRVAGTLDATGAGDGETGGSITVTGEQVALAATAELDASGDAGGGTVHVGGEYRGGGTTPNAQATSVAAGASLKADATDNGDGGEVVVWADATTDFKGSASARGGAEGGDGGLIEVSGQTLTLGGTVDVGAVAGTAGRVLFDPADLTVDSAAATTFVSALSTGGTIDVEASNSITVDAAIDSSAQSSTATLNFKDENGDSDLTVNLNAAISLGANQDLTGEATTVNITDGADIQNGIDVSVSGGTVNVAAGDYYPGDVYYDSRYSDGVTNSQILIDKALTLNGAEGATVHVALPDQSSDLKVDKRTVGFTVAADDVTIDGFTIQGPLDAYSHSTTDFADFGYSYGIFVDQGVKGSQLTNNTIRDLRTGIDYGGDNGASASRASFARNNLIENTRGAFLLRSTGVEISNNLFGTLHNEWDLTILDKLADGDIFTSPFADEAAYGDEMMALSDANNGMTIVDRRYGEGGILTRQYESAGDTAKAAQSAAFANRSHVQVLAGANTDTSAGLGETRGNGYGTQRLQLATIQDGVDAVVKGGYVIVQNGTYAEEVTVDTAGVTISGQTGATLTVDTGDRGFTLAANDVTLSGMTITGPVSDAYTPVDWDAAGSSFGVFVNANVTGATISGNTITDIRTGMYFSDNAAGTVSGNTIDNTKGGILVRDDGTNLTLSGNSKGAIGNEWGVVYNLGNVSTSGIANAARQAFLLETTNNNGGLSVLDRGYGFSNRTVVTADASSTATAAADFGLGNGLGSARQGFASLSDSLDAVVSGGTVNVRGGTYVEDSRIVVDKDVTIAGDAGDKAVITPGTDYNGKTAADAWFLVNSGNTFNLSNVVINGEGYSVWQAIRSHGTASIDSVDFRNLTTVGSGNDYMGLAVAAYGGTVAFGVGNDTHGAGGDASALTVTNSTFENIGRVGILVKGTEATGTVSGNTYVGKGSGDHLDYAIEVSAGGTATITGNTISGIHGVASDTWGSGGIYVHTAYTPGSVITTATIENNVVFDTTNAVIVGTNDEDRSVVTARNNNFAGNDNGVQLMSTGATADFSGNWWGTADDAAIAAYMDSDGFAGSVDFSTFLTGGTDTDAATAGFQGDFSDLAVTELGGQTGTTGRVQEGVDMVDAGGTVTLSDGTYTLPSTLIVAKGGITLTGESEAGVVLDASAVSGYGVSIRELDGITLSNFTLRDAGSYGLKLYKLTDLTLQDVTVRGSGKSEVDLLGVDGAVLTNVTADGQDTKGVGISLVDSHNVAMSGITTAGNQWGGIGIMSNGTYADGGSSNISLTGTNSLAEAYGIYTETDYNAAAPGGYYAITNLTLEGYDYTVQNATFREATVGDSTEHTIYKQTEAEAIDLALALGTPSDSVVRRNSGSTYASIVAGTSVADGSFIVGTSGSSAMSIQAAVNVASDGDTITVNDGSYAAFGTSFGGAENLTIQASADNAIIDASGGVPSNGRIVDLRADGTTIDGFTIVGADAGVGVSVSGQGVTVANNTIRDTLTGIQTTTQYAAGNAVLSGNTITSDYGISLQNTGNTVSGNTVTAAVEGLGVLAGANTLSGNTFTVAAGGEALALYGGAVASTLITSENVVTIGSGAGLQNAVDLAGTDGELNVGAGTYAAENVTISKDGVTLTGAGAGNTIVSLPSVTDGQQVDGFVITADNVTITGFEIAGPVDDSYIDYDWGNKITRGIAVRNGAEDFTIADNTIVNVRNGILIDGRNTGSVKNNVIDNTKSGISVQYTDASGVTISGNGEGTYGNEWGLNLHLNGYWDGTSHHSNPIATVASADWQSALMALSTANGGWSVQDQGYEQANRTHVQVAAGGTGTQGSRLKPLGSLQDGVDGLVDGGYLTVSAGTYSETVTVSRDLNLSTDGTIVLNGLTVDGDLTIRTDVTFDSSAANGDLAFNGDVLGLTDEGQDLTLDAGDGDVTIRNVGTSTVSLGDVTVTAANYYGSAGTSYVASMDVTGDGDVEVGTATVNASGSVNLTGGNVSGSVNASTATVTASTGTANVNVTATQTASVSGQNVQGSVSATTATVTATQNANVTVTATGNASVSGQNVTANVTAPTASVTATQTANVTANVSNLSASTGSGGTITNNGGTTSVSGTGVVAVNGKKETPNNNNPNDEALDPGKVAQGPSVTSTPTTPAGQAFGGNGSVSRPFAGSFSLGISGGGSGLVVAGEGGEGPEADTSGSDGILDFAGDFLSDFWSYYFSPEGGEGGSTGGEGNNGV